MSAAAKQAGILQEILSDCAKQSRGLGGITSSFFTSVCIVDDTGKVVREVKVASEPEALLSVLKNPAYHFKRIGLEAGPLSQWLFSGLAEAELPVVCVETRHMQAVLKAQINKTNRNDARGIAQMMRVGLYRPVHVKTLRSQKLRMLLTHRKLLQSKAIAIENDLRGTLRNFGLKVGMVGKVKFEARIEELVKDFPDLAELVEPLLIVRRAYANRPSSCIAVCWLSCGMMRCAGA